MARGYRFPYSSLDGNPATLMPRLPLTLKLGDQSTEVVGLIDSGASVNVIPFSIGIALGAVWEQQTVSVPLVGSLGRAEARTLIVEAIHSQLTLEHPVELIFAWTRSDNAPLLFGQTNFLMEFRVCFDALQGVFEIYPKAIEG
jgi:hypothetical protein